MNAPPAGAEACMIKFNITIPKIIRPLQALLRDYIGA